MQDKLNPPCGCRNSIDPEWNVLRSVTKCVFHKSLQGKHGLDHHRDLGSLVGNQVQFKLYEDELKEALKEMGLKIGPVRRGKALEIGCGLAMYSHMIKKAGYEYFGLEPDVEVAEFARRNVFVPVDTRPFEDYTVRTKFELILCAHAFEHMKDAPGMMRKAFGKLNKGGELVIIIPNDDDPCNPDHLYFFTPDNLRTTLERIGFSKIDMVTRRRVPHELFIYAVARK